MREKNVDLFEIDPQVNSFLENMSKSSQIVLLPEISFSSCECRVLFGHMSEVIVQGVRMVIRCSKS